MDIPSKAQVTAQADQWGALVRELVTTLQGNAHDLDATSGNITDLLLRGVGEEPLELAKFALFVVVVLAANIPAEDLRVT